MTPDSLTSSFAETFTAMANAVIQFAWFLLALAVIWKLLPVLRRIIESRAFVVKFAGMELSVQDASDQFRDQLNDLQRKVVTLLAGDLKEGVQRVHPETPTPAPSPDDQVLPIPRGGRRAIDAAADQSSAQRILWVDDRPKNNAVQIATLEDAGVEIDQVRSTEEALRRLDTVSKPYTLVITDMGRSEDGRHNHHAGLDLLQQLRQRHPTLPIFSFASESQVRSKAADFVRAGGTGMTSSTLELYSMLREAGIPI